MKRQTLFALFIVFGLLVVTSFVVTYADDRINAELHGRRRSVAWMVYCDAG